jgi:hypothetical protein
MLPPRIKAFIKMSSHLSHQKQIAGTRANITNAGNIIRHSAARQVDEVGPEAAMAIEKILRMPS